MTWTVKTKNGMSVMKYLHILALGIVALAVSVPLMTNYCIDGVNVSFYLRRLQKICPEDIFLLLPSLLVRAGAPVEFVYKLLLFGLNVATAGISYLCFYGIFRDRLTGVMGSMLYTWAPYRLNDLYCRADLGEAIALCFLPILFYGLYQICREETDSREYRRLWIVLALGYTLIVQAYLLSFLVAVGFTILYGILTWKRICRRPALIVLLKTAAAFLVCNLWLFLILFLRLREGAFSMAAFRGEMIQSGGVFPSVFLQLFFLNGSSFRTAGVGTENMQPMGIGFAVTAGVLIFLWLVFVGRYRDRMEDREFCRFEKSMGIAGAIVAVMATNCFPWDWLQRQNGVFFRLIASLQSPSRLMPMVLLCFIVLTCGVVWQVKKQEKASVGMSLAMMIAALSLVSVQYLTGDILSTGEPRSLYGVEYGEPEGEERLLPENLDISPWDYGKYEKGN